MQRGKAFFYVCAGLFLLTAIFRLGVPGAAAQSGTVDIAEISGSDIYAATIGRTVYVATGSGAGAPLSHFQVYPPVPGSSPIVAVRGPTNGVVTTVLANADVYSVDGFLVWTFAGNLLSGGAVNVERHTLGQLKARFRSPAPSGR